RGESPELPGSRIIVDGIQGEMQKSRNAQAEIYLETIETGRTPGEAYERRLANLFEEKYRDVHFDLVIALTEPATGFLLRERAILFPGTPALVGLVDRRMVDLKTLPPDIGVAFAQVDAASTLRFALRAHPLARRVLVTAGISRFDRGWLSVVRDDLRAFEKG